MTQLATPYVSDQRRIIGAILRSADVESWFRVFLNGVDVVLPRDTLRTMVHCFDVQEGVRPNVWVETAHLKWMMARIAAGGTFLDIGAATGATTLPIALNCGESVRIVAYEPSRSARRLLEKTLARNAITTVTVRPVAVSKQVGSAEFLEYGYDDTDEIPYLPETSALALGHNRGRTGTLYSVPTVTLDQELPTTSTLPTVVKIDVEGFESCVIEGARTLLTNCRPYLSIDIHTDPFCPEQTTEGVVRAELSKIGYSFEKVEHVLLCSPV